MLATGADSAYVYSMNARDLLAATLRSARLERDADIAATYRPGPVSMDHLRRCIRSVYLARIDDAYAAHGVTRR